MLVGPALCGSSKPTANWLVAMDDGKVIATGTTPEILQKTGETDLEAAFIALLPEAKRAHHQKVVARPRSSNDDAVPAIEAIGLTRQFGNFTAVDHVSFRIGRGEIFGFLGSNGCGKSTTMKMLTGLLPATSGTAKLFGTPMGSNDMEARRNVGYMSQAFSLYNELTVRQNLELHAQLYHLPADKVDARIKELLSPSLEDAFISYLAEAAGIKVGDKVPPPAQDQASPPATEPQHRTNRFDPGRLWAYARRETMELLRDPIRLTFALLGPLILMIAFGYGISLDVEHLRFTPDPQIRSLFQ